MTTGAVCALALALAASPGGTGAVPSPESTFGFRPGTDRKLADYETMVRYFRALAAASDRVRLEEIGPTSEGRTMIAVLVSSAANLTHLERYREINRRLALARGLDEKAARSLAEEGKVFVWIDSGLHASEVAHAQHAPELAYRVATEESAEMRRIRDQVILLLVPVLNPDGLDRVTAWYARNLGTPFEVAPMVELYHKYVGHDNNRDFYMFNMPESKNVARLLYREYFPEIVYNHHQSAPFPARIFVPPFDDPMNPNIPPLVMRGIEEVGSAITARLEREGKRGAISRQRFDTWWNGGMRTAPDFHNMVGILTETALWRYATPRTYDPKDFPDRFRDGTPTLSPSTFYPSPWQGGSWHLRDAVDYMLTASIATLAIGAERRVDWLRGAYAMGRDAIAAGEAGPPYAWVIPKQQWDPGAATSLVEVLERGGVEVRRAEVDFDAGGERYPAGSFVVLMAQPFRAYAKDLLEVQHYPDRREGRNGPPRPPYDISGWTLPAQMGVAAARVEEPFAARLALLSAGRPAGEGIQGSGPVLLVDGRANEAFLLANRALDGGATVRRAAAGFEAAGRSWTAGTFVVEGGDRQAFDRLARERSLPVAAIATAPEVPTRPARRLRIGLYKSWMPSIDEGWTRWILEQYGFPYASLTDAEVRKGGLADRFDVILLPDASPRRLLHGWASGQVPPEFTGGLGLDGALALERFAEGGGTLVALGAASALPLQLFDLPVSNVLEGVRREDYYCPGGILRLELDASQPLAWGMPETAFAFTENDPAFREDGIRADGTREPGLGPTGRPRPAFVARFASAHVLYSGWLLGGKKIAGKGALLEVPEGKGRVVLVGFRCQFRGQSLGTYKLLFNALL